MNRVEILLSGHADKFEWLVQQGKLTAKRSDAIRSGNAKITRKEAELIADACSPAFPKELLLQLQQDDQMVVATETATPSTASKTSAESTAKISPKSSSRSYGYAADTTGGF
jgi:hypothetical protein